MPRRKAGTSLPVARRATTIRWHTSFSACGGAEGSSRYAGMSLPVARRATTVRWHTSFSACGGAEGSSRCAGMSLPYGSAELLRDRHCLSLHSLKNAC
ncbi:MAG: hypothetical protein IKS21_04685, partial [Oscillospiraceae bacterium]|nr:hypothetical protein [Oscillospiraceae bacterium]